MLTENQKLKVEELLKANKGIKDPNIRKLTRIMIENQIEHGNEGLNEAGTSFFNGSFGGTPEDTSTFSSDGIGWNGLAVPIVRSVWPSLLAPYVVATVPMKSSTAKVMYMKTVADQAYTDSVTGTAYAAGTGQLGYNAVQKDFTGSYSTTASERVGIDTTFPSASLMLDGQTCTAQYRKIRSSWSLEVQNELMASHSMDIRSEMLSELSKELVAELDLQIIDTIKSAATSGAWNFDNTSDTGSARWSMEAYAALYHKLIRECNQVAISTRMGRASWVIASPTVCAIFESLSNFIQAPLDHDLDTGNMPATPLIGALAGGKIKVYMNTFQNDDSFTVGFKSGNLKSGLTWCPWIPLQVYNAVSESNFAPSVGLMSAYGLVQHPHIDRFYRTTKCVNLPQ